jgi:hypothetical protein
MSLLTELSGSLSAAGYRRWAPLEPGAAASQKLNRYSELSGSLWTACYRHVAPNGAGYSSLTGAGYSSVTKGELLLYLLAFRGIDKEDLTDLIVPFKYLLALELQ